MFTETTCNWNKGTIYFDQKIYATAIKYAFWLFVLTVGSPDLIDGANSLASAVAEWIGRQG